MLIDKGESHKHNMRAHLVTTTDLQKALQTQLHTNNFDKVESVYLTTDGIINFITKS